MRLREVTGNDVELVSNSYLLSAYLMLNGSKAGNIFLPCWCVEYNSSYLQRSGGYETCSDFVQEKFSFFSLIYACRPLDMNLKLQCVCSLRNEGS